MGESRLALGLALAALAVPAASPKNTWKASGSGTDMTLTLEAQATAALSIRSTLGPTRPKLVLKCHDRKPMVGVFIGSLDENAATVRFDREPAFRIGLYNRLKWGKLWMTSTIIDPETLFFDRPKQVAASLTRHRRMLVRVTPAFRPAQEVTFELPDLEPLLPAFEKECDLKEPIERSSAAAAAPPPAPPPSRSAKPPAPALQTFGGWRQSVTTSKIDDLPIILLSLPQTKGSSASRPASLVLRCREKEAEAFLKFDLPLFGPRGGYLVVRASVDGGTQVEEWWLAPSTEGRAYFFGSAPQLLKRLLASHELRLAYRPRKHPESYTWMPQGESVFSLAGIDRASKAYLDACPIDLAKVKVKDGLAKIP
jgi:hypothetical protein